MVAFLKKLKKKGDFRKFLFLFFIIVFLLFLILNMRIGREKGLAGKQIDLLEKELSGLEAAKNKFSAEMSELGNEEYLEKMARQDFNLKKEGENVVVFSMEENNSTTSAGELKSKKNLWQKLLGILGIEK